MNRGLFAVVAMVLAVAVVTGSGAFTLVSAERQANVPVVADPSAVLGLSPAPGENGRYAVVDPETGLLMIDATSPLSGADATGFNSNARVIVTDVFAVQNQGTQPVRIWITVRGSDAVRFFATDPETGDRFDVTGRDGAPELGVGSTLWVGFEADTTGISPDGDLVESISINAASGPIVTDPDGTAPPDLDDDVVVAPDAFEPNDLRDQAAVIGEQTYVGPTIGEVGDVDWYRIDPVPTGFFGFSSTVFVEVEEAPSSSGGTLFVRLEDQDGNVLDEGSGSSVELSYEYVSSFNKPSELYVRIAGSDTPQVHSYTLDVSSSEWP